MAITRMDHFVSIISPIRNEGKYLAACLDSIISQDYDKDQYEIIIVDGMSDDISKAILATYCEKYPQIKLLHNPQKIAPTALNLGIAEAKGDIFIRVDGHVILQEDYITQCVNYMKATGADCVGGVIESINDSYIGKVIALAMSSVFGVGNARFRTSGAEGFVDTLAFGAYRRDVIRDIGLFDEELVRSQDDEFNYRLRKFGKKIFFTPQIKSFYYSRSNLKELWKQYFQYGFWKVRVLQKHFSMMQWRQFVPPVFVLLLLVCLGLMSFYQGAVYFLSAMTISYSLLSLIFSLKTALKTDIRFFPLLPVAFGILHFSYGMGFLWGMIRFAAYWFRSDQKKK